MAKKVTRIEAQDYNEIDDPALIKEALKTEEEVVEEEEAQQEEKPIINNPAPEIPEAPEAPKNEVTVNDIKREFALELAGVFINMAREYKD